MGTAQVSTGQISVDEAGFTEHPIPLRRTPGGVELSFRHSAIMEHIWGVPENGELERSRCGPAHGPIESHCRLSAIKGGAIRGEQTRERGSRVIS